MTTLPPSPFVTESVSAPVENQSSVSTELEAAASCTEGGWKDAAADLDDIPEIFRCANLLCIEARRREQIDRAGLRAVADEIAAWQADVDPLPIFLGR